MPMQRFSYLLIHDSDSDSSERSTARTVEAGKRDDVPLHRPDADGHTERERVDRSQGASMRDTAAATQLRAPPSTSPETNPQGASTGYHASLLGSLTLSDGASAQGRPMPDLPSWRDGSQAYSLLLPEAAHATGIKSFSADAVSPHIEGASLAPDIYYKNSVLTGASAVNAPLMTAPLGSRIPTAPLDTHVAAVTGVQDTQSGEQAGIRPQRTTTSPSAELSTLRESMNYACDPLKSSSERGATATATATAGDTAADGRWASLPRLPVDVAQHFSPLNSAQWSAAIAAPTQHNNSLPVPVAASPKKVSAYCGLFSFCRQKKKSMSASDPVPALSSAAAEAVVNTEAQSCVTATAGERPNIAASAAAAFGHDSAPQESEVREGQAALLSSDHELAASASAKMPVSEAVLSPKEAGSGLLGSSHTEGKGDGVALAHRKSPRSIASQGAEMSWTDSEQPESVSAGMVDVQGQTSEESLDKGVEGVVQSNSREQADRGPNVAESANLEKTSDKSEGLQQSAYTKGTRAVKASATPPSQGSLSGGKTVSSTMASSASIEAMKMLSHSHAVVGAPSSSPSQSDNGKHTGSSSSSHAHSNRRKGSRASGLPSTVSTSFSVAHRPPVSGTPLRHSPRVSTAPSGHLSAYDTSSPSRQNPQSSNYVLQEEHLLLMPAYQRRILLDLRARERRDAEEAAKEWRDLTFRPHIHVNPFSNDAHFGRDVATGRKHSPLGSVHGSPEYSPASGFWESSPGRNRIHRMSARLLEPRCTPRQPALPSFKPVISEYAKESVRPAYSVFKRLYRPRSPSPPYQGDGFTHVPNISQMARQLYGHGHDGRFSQRHSEENVAAPHSISVFDRLYRLRKVPVQSRAASPRRSLTPRRSSLSRSSENAIGSSTRRSRQSLQNLTDPKDQPQGHESHSPFHTREDHHGDVGNERVLDKASNGAVLSSSQLSFTMKDAVKTSSSFHHSFSEIQTEIETV